MTEKDRLLLRGRMVLHRTWIEVNRYKRLHACDDSGVVVSTGNVLDAAVPKVLQWFWQIYLEQKCSVAQLTVLAPSKRIHTILCKQQQKITQLHFYKY